MSQRIRETRAMHMLKQLGSKTMHWSDWNALCRTAILLMNADVFLNMCKYMVKRGYVEQLSNDVYRVSDEGKRRLGVWETKMRKERARFHFQVFGDARGKKG